MDWPVRPPKRARKIAGKKKKPDSKTPRLSFSLPTRPKETVEKKVAEKAEIVQEKRKTVKRKAVKRKKMSDPDGDFVQSKKQKKVSGGKLLVEEVVDEGDVVESLRVCVGFWRKFGGLDYHFGHDVEVVDEESAQGLVYLVVDGSEFAVARSLIRAFSPVLRLALKDLSIIRYVVARTTKLAVFLLIRSLESGTLKGASGAGYEYSIRDYMNLALLANRFFVAQVQNEALKAVHFVVSSTAYSFTEVTMPGLEYDIHTVYEHARNGSIIREFLANLIAVYVDFENVVAVGNQQFELGFQAYPVKFVEEWGKVVKARGLMAKGGNDFDMAAYTVRAYSGLVRRELLMPGKRW